MNLRRSESKYIRLNYKELNYFGKEKKKYYEDIR